MIERRRRLVLAAGAAWLGASALAAAAGRPIPSMTEGPFYPPRPWRERRGSDWDGDLTQVREAGRTLTARGEHFGLELMVADTAGRVVDRAEVEIWQCDALATYHHPNVRVEAADQIDAGFQGFGAARAGGDGVVRFRTIKPVPYPGRTPHIHVRLRHAAFGEWTSQLFVDGDPGNAGDGLWRRLSESDRRSVAIRLQPSQADGLRWQARHTLVLAV
jgi:protocatechuate 3,4-dioxygenase beta subunit